MSQTTTSSSVITGGVTVTAATLVPLVQWAMGGFPKPIPPDVPYLVAAGIVTAAHALYNYLAARASKAATPSVTVTNNVSAPQSAAPVPSVPTAPQP